MTPNGATIGTLHTYDDLRLVPKSKLTVNPAPPKYITFDVPGTDGEIDVTEAIYGGVAYGNRRGSWEFLVMAGSDYIAAYTNCLSLFNGQLLNIVLDDEPGTTYVGRVSINEWLSQEQFSRIVLDYIIETDSSNANGTIGG